MTFTPKRVAYPTLSKRECTIRIGTAYNIPFPWEDVTTPAVKDWLENVAGARNCRPEYIFMSALPTVSALCGPDTRLKICGKGFHFERLNNFLCILGETGASK